MLDITSPTLEALAPPAAPSGLESSGDALLAVDATGIIEEAGGGVQPLLGYRPADVIGRPLESLVSRTCREEVRRAPEEACREGTVRTLWSLVGLRADGAEFPLVAVIDPSPGPILSVTLRHRSAHLGRSPARV